MTFLHMLTCKNGKLGSGVRCGRVGRVRKSLQTKIYPIVQVIFLGVKEYHIMQMMHACSQVITV